MLVPKLVTCLKKYSKDQFIKDFISGIIVAIIALPLSIALAIASGVSPEKGLYTAIIGGFIVSLLGGSRVQIGGPTGAFVVIVYGIIQKHGVEGLIIATIMAGIFLIIMGALKLGSLIKYIPFSITTGFTTGIAVVIFSTQIKDLLGLQMQSVPSDFISKWIAYIKHMNTISMTSVSVSLITLAIIILWPKINKKIPGTFVAIIVVTLLCSLLKLKVDTIGSEFHNLSSAFPKFTIPNVNLKIINELMMPAITIAVLGSVESLLSAVVADGMIKDKHQSNTELIAQGIANIFSGVFGGIPVTGAIARTAANIKNGGRTPVAGMVHAVSLLFIMMIFMPYVRLIPMASLAAILVMVSYNMGDWKAFERILRAPKTDAFIFLITFVLTIVLDLVQAIGIGIVLSSLLFMRKMAQLTDVKYMEDVSEDEEICELLNGIENTEDIAVYEINGPFFFGAASKFVSSMSEISMPPKALIIKMEKVPFMDATAYQAFKTLYENCSQYGTNLIIVRLQQQPFDMLKKYGYMDIIGKENFCDDMESALEKLKKEIA
ncbi:sulfate permease [Clostridium sp. 19966]|uniref:SulP family inorganic anion transporter n=1 Tax=Clostridium sp. 19966 TaxID=2768166 RepID=UPI0028E096E4|nr:sulfate permease [Clostridium sp. 19966]MDT8717938.1 sulfate permease [Clostridium sp. 19966]